MKQLMRVFPALLLFCLFGARGEASTEWVRLVTNDADGYVLSVDGNSVMIDASISRGARKGGLYLVYSDAGDIYDVNGAYIGKGKTPLAVLKVREPSTTHSFSVIMPPSNGLLVQPGDRIEPISATRAKRVRFAKYRTNSEPAYGGDIEGYISQSPYSDELIAITPVAVAVPTAPPAQIVIPAATPVPAAAPVRYAPPVQTAAPIRVPAATPVQSAAQLPLPPVTTVQVPAPPRSLPAPVTTAQIVVPAAPGYYYVDSPSYNVVPVRSAAQPIIQGSYPPPPAVRPEPPHPPAPSNPANYDVMLDYDANKIADARLIRTFPLAQVEMNTLEIQHRSAWDLYSKQRYLEAFESFANQSVQFKGNYLSPYWAGICSLKLKNLEVADAWFNRALEINPYYEPARNAKQNAAQYVMKSSQPKESAKKPVPQRRTRTRRAK
ncbi:MAG: hypothetical protein LBT31_07140 [Synergistaceae bacterium]|nr:hypothetical protein [Synergistaceae bacterium]